MPPSNPHDGEGDTPKSEERPTEITPEPDETSQQAAPETAPEKSSNGPAIREHSQEASAETTKKDIPSNPPRIYRELPCAHTDAPTHWACPNTGKMTCARCHIVRYCSKECQTGHWRRHKIDCKDPLISKEWLPGWVIDDRVPAFDGAGSSPDLDWARKDCKEHPLALGMHLWGNLPAMDVVNLSLNESSLDQNLSLAFVASGDLKHVIRTINDLPQDYTGEIDILLNDREPLIVVRNMILLLILGTISDKARAIEVAVHCWYSAFFPRECDDEIRKVIHAFWGMMAKADEAISISSSLGESSQMSGIVAPAVVACLMIMAKEPPEVKASAQERMLVTFHAPRQDRHHRHYNRLKPAHRLALEDFRRFGMVLPFGARKDLCNTANRFLFSPDCKWLQDDLANPLDSWDIPAIISAGKAHGATPEDLYGCLYFYLSDQLRIFTERLHRLRIHFRFFSEEASELSEKISADELIKQAISAPTRFDRIYLSNLLDAEYGALSNTIPGWAMLLKDNPHATILGYFMNWPNRSDGATASSKGSDLGAKLMKELQELGRIPAFKPAEGPPMPSKQATGLMLCHLNSLTAGFDNSKAFQDYLDKHNMDRALRRSRLKLKEAHTIIPHRLCAPLGSSPDTVPVFPSNEDWYWNICVGNWLWSERFAEISRAQHLPAEAAPVDMTKPKNDSDP